jgi:hypothetical protein
MTNAELICGYVVYYSTKNKVSIKKIHKRVLARGINNHNAWLFQLEIN